MTSISWPLLALVLSTPPAADEPVRFNRDVRPILSEHCFACHGPDKNKREADLRLDRSESATADRDGFAVIVPGDVDASELIARVSSDDDTERMPPVGHGDGLTGEQVVTLRRWIAGGAEYEPHWAYTALVRPEVPRGGDPQPAQASAGNPVDAFIRERLAAEGIEPSSEADRRTLIRRVTLDMTGLPPTLEEIDAFVADDSPDAYERLIDRLLASERFAERMATGWLDAVRYADTVGFHGDQLMSVWPYRDYVLKSFHENKPFDVFTREQIAGDLIEGATREAKVASAFNRLNRMTTEGGAQDKEYRAKYAADRVRTLGIVWLGATIGCAECHDHKFDPILTRDFYRMAAFWADVEEEGFYDGGFGRGDWGPTLELASPEQESELAALDAQIAAIRAEIEAVADESIAPARAEWEKRTVDLDAKGRRSWIFAHPTSATSANGTELVIDTDTISAGGPSPDKDTYEMTFKPGTGRWHSLLLETKADERYPGNRISRAWVSYLLTGLEVEAAAGGSAAPSRIELAEAVADHQSDRFPAMAALDDDPATGWAHEHGGTANHRLLVRFADPVETTDDSTWTVRLRHEGPIRRATIGRFRVGLTEVEGATLDAGLFPEDVVAALKIDPYERTKEQHAAVAKAYRRAAPELAEQRARLARVEMRRALVHGAVPVVLTTTRAEKPREVRVLPRGDWMDETGEVVEPGTPEFLPGPDESSRRLTRLDLADWLVSAENPLTPRVFANRMWKQFFGVGLSKTLDDIGSQGEWPSHLELLDWLACEFRSPEVAAHGESAKPHAWDVKHLVRLIVTSGAYRQSSAVRPELAERDPENRLLARQMPIRFDAEQVRDAALAASGLLVERFGGPSVFPAQPDGYWAALNFPRREYTTSVGSDQYRRSVYTHWQRTFVHPSLLVFDAATREECQVARMPSNTPLQALTLLNDPIFVEAARVLGQSALKGKGGDAERIGRAFARVVGRAINDEERAVLLGVLEAHRGEYRSHPERAEALLAIGEAPGPKGADPVEAASYAAVARVILNLHEAITRD